MRTGPTALHTLPPAVRDTVMLSLRTTPWEDDEGQGGMGSARPAVPVLTRPNPLPGRCGRSLLRRRDVNRLRHLGSRLVPLLPVLFRAISGARPIRPPLARPALAFHRIPGFLAGLQHDDGRERVRAR